MHLGEIQTLKINRFVEFGAYLVDVDSNANGASVKNGEVLLPKKQLPEGAKENDTIEVFLYKDSEDRMIATTTIPPLTIGKLSVLTVKEVASIGAFLDWGLSKDLLLPFKEQTSQVKVGDQILVSLYIDKSNRLCATMKVYEYLQSGILKRQMKRMRKSYKERFEFAKQCVEQYLDPAFVWGDGGLHLYVGLREVSARLLLQVCYERKVIFMPGDIFSLDDRGENTLRLGLSRVSLEEIETGIKIMGECLAQLRNKAE